MQNKDRIDLLSIDYLSLSPGEREEIRRGAIRRAHAERAAMMDAVVSALPRLIRRAFKRLAARKGVRPVTIPRREIVQI